MLILTPLDYDCIFDCISIYHNCGFSPKENIHLQKTYHYWTDWHIANRRPLAVKQCDRMLQ